jgi:hypothetical protein
VTVPCTVLIAPIDRLPTLKGPTLDDSTELLTFADTEALRALEAITRRLPKVVAVERLFAASPRGAALINRIKIDPKLADCEIHVVSHDSDYSRISPRRPPPTPERPLDQRGTRRALRSKMAANVNAQLDGNTALLVDLSIVGAQVVSGVPLKPDQRVAMTLLDGTADVRFNASVAWTSFEIPPSGRPRYRAGINFEDADAEGVDAFCARHKA